LPYAHFDAETFTQSNQRVINFTTQIYSEINSDDYDTARALSGQIMHTIQDFYSHSNWVEMGHTNDINYAIGSVQFNSLPVATAADNVTCVSNCTEVSVTCSPFIQLLNSFLQLIKFHSFKVTCPILYYRCTGNLVQLNKLVSGYYSGQKLDNGDTIAKPDGMLKCSHGVN
jgi:hypothetical protein